MIIKWGVIKHWLDFCKLFAKWEGVGNNKGSDLEILLLSYLEIELAFQIMNITMVSFEFLCLIFYSNSYVSYVRMFIYSFY